MKRLACLLLGLLSAATASAATAPMVLAYYSGNDGNDQSLTQYYTSFNAVSLDYYSISSDGGVSDSDLASYAIAFLKSKGMPAYACVSNYDTDWNPTIAHNVITTGSMTAVNNLVAIAQRNQFAGINIDFESVLPADRHNLSNFALALGDALHAQGLKLIISVPAFSGVDASDPYNAAYDLHALGAAADFVQIMTYDESIPPGAPGPVAGSDWIKMDLEYAVTQMPAAKVLSGLPAYGYDWKPDNTGTMLPGRNTSVLISQYGVVPSYDTTSDSLTFNYTASDGTGTHTVWTENPQSITVKARLVGIYGLAGTSVWALGMDDASYWAALHAGLRQ